MHLAYNASQHAPQQPIEDPSRFPAFVPAPGRMLPSDREFRERCTRVAQSLGLDPDDVWEKDWLITASRYAREDEERGDSAAHAEQAADAPKRGRGRPKLYDELPGETPAERKKRLRQQRTKRQTLLEAGAPALELYAAIEQVRTLTEQLAAARVRLAEARAAVARARARVVNQT